VPNSAKSDIGDDVSSPKANEEVGLRKIRAVADVATPAIVSNKSRLVICGAIVVNVNELHTNVHSIKNKECIMHMPYVPTGAGKIFFFLPLHFGCFL
jgi:hypothetical protein